MKAAALRLCAALLLLASAAHALEVEVTDGDTFILNGQTIRLWGLDAPDLTQECRRGGRAWYPGPNSAEALKDVLSKMTELSCETRDVDRQGRSVATCYGNGQDVGNVLVRAGHAFDFFEYSKGFYLPAEMKAKSEQLGVWAGECEDPWRYRRQNRPQRQATPPAAKDSRR